ncbi:hypothetical protein AX774_g6632 [Zancudomyces culisetae]|uniref:Uncharacterized protein n=1 Tax=Zancudomyces culisetae TaxID=1213189 RepID=A0A1R1PG40_ZANCU|nr:hypothetical protein AX774_g6632 [Zancudomyces culisetae]|eukprot:OMH79941.1 hypothetical protein AX774_g6632 [Zancudomyces culisetae]
MSSTSSEKMNEESSTLINRSKASTSRTPEREVKKTSRKTGSSRTFMKLYTEDSPGLKVHGSLPGYTRKSPPNLSPAVR